MLKLLGGKTRLCDGVTRREWLRVGGLGAFGLSLPQVLAAPAAAPRRAKACIVLWMAGGPPQHETWDPKPDAPAEIRGPFGSIATSIPGVRFGELMPRTASLAHRIAVLRAMVTDNPGHAGGSYELLTGVEHPAGKGNENISASRGDFPYFGSIIKRFHPGRIGAPTSVAIPQSIFNVPVWPGQDAGFMGSSWDPWRLTCDLEASDLRIDALTLQADVPSERLATRRSLLERVAGSFDRGENGPGPTRFSGQVAEAFNLLAGQRVRAAFDLNREPATVRQRYGRHMFGKGCLLARRLVESGVTLVQVNWQRDTPADEQPMWDCHYMLQTSMKRNAPPMDHGYTALLEDLDQRGLLDETLVIWMGEMGRTPKFERIPKHSEPGRNHWGHVFSIALAGAGVRAGLVHGASDRIGGYPLDGKVTPPDLIATVFHCLGLSPTLHIHDRLNRPLPITTGKVLDAIF